jgi:hypothetical protein
MKKSAFLLALLLLNALLFAENTSDKTLVSIPDFYPDSDAFFAAEFQNAFSKFPSFFYFDAFGELIYIPKGADAVPKSTNDALGRGAASIGTMLPLGEHLSGIASFSIVLDHPYIAQSMNFFTGAGLFGDFEPFGLGLFAGYYRDSYKKLSGPDASGVYTGLIDEQPADVTNAVRFMVIPKIGLSDTIFFLDEIGALFNVSENFGVTNILGRLAFSTLELGAMRLGVDLYYTQNKYNLLIDSKTFGAKFETKFVSINAGYRWFEPDSDNIFLSNYENGAYGRIILKLPYGSVNILLSYGFERTFETMHYIGLGFSLPLDDWTNDYYYEFGANSLQNMRFSGANLTSLERYF